MEDWKDKLKSIKQISGGAIKSSSQIGNLEPKANKEKIKFDEEENLSNKINSIVKQITLEKQKSFKNKDQLKIKALEDNLKIKRNQFLSAISNIKKYYPDLSINEIGIRQVELENKIKNDLYQLRIDQETKLSIEKERREREKLDLLKKIEDEKIKLKKEVAKQEKRKVLKEKKYLELLSITAKQLIKEYKIVKCINCVDGKTLQTCSYCEGTGENYMRRVTKKSQMILCSNKSSDCPNCGGNGYYFHSTQSIEPKCECLSGKIFSACNFCKGTTILDKNSDSNFHKKILKDNKLIKILQAKAK